MKIGQQMPELCFWIDFGPPPSPKRDPKGHYGIHKGSKKFEIIFSTVLILLCTLLNCYLIFLSKFYDFSLFESFWGHFDQKKALKMSEGVQKFWNNFFYRFYTHMFPFQLLLDFFEQILHFFLIWVILGVFGGFGGPKKGVRPGFRPVTQKNLERHCLRLPKSIVRKINSSGALGPILQP